MENPTIIIFITLVIYFLPSMIASSRHHLDVGSIFILNLLCGWTGLFWIIALIWAASGNIERNHNLEVK